MDILLTRFHDIPQSRAIPELTDAKLADLNIPTPHQIAAFENVVRGAKEKGITDPWVRVLESRLKEHKKAQNKNKKPAARIGALIKRIIRG
jgi:hypothetical protein